MNLVNAEQEVGLKYCLTIASSNILACLWSLLGRNTLSNVDHPKHYNAGNIEVIDAIEAWNMGFCDGNVVKYVARHKFKGKPLEDLKKAKWYLDRLIQQYEQENRIENTDK